MFPNFPHDDQYIFACVSTNFPNPFLSYWGISKTSLLTTLTFSSCIEIRWQRKLFVMCENKKVIGCQTRAVWRMNLNSTFWPVKKSSVESCMATIQYFCFFRTSPMTSDKQMVVYQSHLTVPRYSNTIFATWPVMPKKQAPLYFDVLRVLKDSWFVTYVDVIQSLWCIWNISLHQSIGTFFWGIVILCGIQRKQRRSRTASIFFGTTDDSIKKRNFCIVDLNCWTL